MKIEISYQKVLTPASYVQINELMESDKVTSELASSQLLKRMTYDQARIAVEEIRKGNSVDLVKAS